MNRYKPILLFLCLVSSYVTAQHNLRCPSDEPRRQYLLEYPDAFQEIAQREAAIAAWIDDYQSSAALRSDEIYTIPVVVHVVWYEEEDNIPEEQIIAQMAILNEDFSFKNQNTFFIPSEFESRVATVGFEFCLASLDPDGNPTNGITRTQTDYDGIGNFCETLDPLQRKRIFHTDLGGKDAWDTDRYLNIWVAPMKGLFGRATPPEPFISNDPCSQMEPNEDGVIVDPKYFGPSCYPPQHLGRTVTHEIGHYFNLLHTFGLDTDDCDTDFVDDTPEQMSPYFGCPRYPQASCTSSDMFMNFMDLVDDECMAMFTEGQKLRMLAALLGPRRGLIENEVCVVPPLSDNFQLRTFPNPTTDCINIRFESPVENEVINLRIFDAAGKMVYTGRHNALTIPSVVVRQWGDGLFIVELTTKTDRYINRVLVF